MVLTGNSDLSDTPILKFLVLEVVFAGSEYNGRKQYYSLN